MRTRALASTIVVGALALGLDAQSGWPSHGRDPGMTRFSPLNEINTENVGSLELVWTYDTLPPEQPVPAAGGPSGGRGAAALGPATASRPPGADTGPRPRESAATPLVIGDVLYLSTAYNHVVALDPESGAEIWVRDVGHPIARRGMAYWHGVADIAPRLVFGTTDGWLIALDARTGEFSRGFGEAGLVSLKQGVADAYPDGRVALSSPPAIYGHLAITGAHAQESPSFGPSGDVRAWDLRSGQLVWTFHTIPRPGEPNHDAWQDGQWEHRAGANAWGLITVDEARGMVFVPVGTPATDFYGADRLGSNLYGSSLLALDAATGRLRWHFQTTHHDNWDYDLTSPPALIDVRRNGRTIPAVAQYSKQGLLFMFDRETGEPIFDVVERPVVSDNPLPGDVYWPTQPFPTRPAPLARMTFSPDEVATVTPDHEQYCRALLALEGGAMTGGPYAQYGPKLRVIFPGWTGGGNWNGAAFDPTLGYLFLPNQDLGMLNKMVPSERDPEMYVRVGPDGAPPGMGTNFWNGEKGWPCQQPPWGELVAVDVNAGEVAWRVPLGSFEELDALGVPRTGTPNRGGPIVTAGGLVFIGASQDARFRAFDARTGAELWVADLSENGRTVPITYQGKSGKQYVAILAGGGRPVGRTVDESQIGGRLHVYALPGSPPADAFARAAQRQVSGRPVPPPPAQGRPGAAQVAARAVRANSSSVGGAAGARTTRPATRPPDQRPPATAGTGISAAQAVSPAVSSAEAGALVERLCTECHTLDGTFRMRYSRQGWSEVVYDMVAQGAQGTDAELALVIDYLASNYGIR